MTQTPVQLGPDDEHLLPYWVKPGTRHIREAPMFVERFSTGEMSHKGDAFWQHFVMAGFRGGQGQDVFEDVEMVQQMVGLDGTYEGKLVPWRGFTLWQNPAATTTATPPDTYWAYPWRPRIFQVDTDEVSHVMEKIRTLIFADTIGTTGEKARIWWSKDRGETWFYHELTSRGSQYQGITAMAHFSNPEDGKRFHAFGDRYGDIFTSDDGLETFLKHVNHPLVAGQAISAMHSFNGLLYVAQNNKIWTYNGKGDARANWSAQPLVKADCHITCMTVWNGALWVGGYQSFHGKVYRVDGVGVIEVCALNDNMNVLSLCAYDGSLFIGGAAYDEGKQRMVGRVYRFSGTSLRELDLGKAGVKRQADFLQGVYDMAVWQGKLILPAADYHGVLAYDAREDAFFRLPRIDPSFDTFDADVDIVYNIAVFEGTLYLSVPARGIYKYDPASYADSETYAFTYYFDTSWYDAGVPLVDKRFQDVLVELDGALGTDVIDVYYRTDETADFALLGSITGTDRQVTLPDNTLAKRVQLRFDFTYRDPVAGPAWTFKGFYLRYTVEPRVRRSWSMTLVCADDVETTTPYVDAPTERARDERSGKQMRDALWAMRDTRDLWRFVDVDGVAYWCVVSGLSEYQPSIDYDGTYESEVSLILWEV